MKQKNHKLSKNRRRKPNPDVAETLFETPFGAYKLHRYPQRRKDTLRAWDAADSYCIDYLSENDVISSDSRVVIFNDGFGGLSIPLHQHAPTVITDSFVAMQGIRHNLAENDIDDAAVHIDHSLQDIAQLLPGGVDVVLIKIPKGIAMLEFQLHRLRPSLREDTVVIAAGMTRNIHNSTMEAFASIIGPTHSTLAKKKARLILSKPDRDIDAPACDYPVDYELEIQSAEGDEQQSIILSNHAGVFSAAKLDPGTGLFLQHIATDPRYRTIIDLGCGNGLLGITAALKNPSAKLVFADESFMAVDSAAINFQRMFPEVAGEAGRETGGEAAREATFLQTDCLHGVEAESADLILCNPPFHQNNIITDSVAWRMFSESRDVLRPGGELWVIGNRHLAYHAKLKHLFGNCETIASDKRFSLVRAVKKSG